VHFAPVFGHSAATGDAIVRAKFEELNLKFLVELKAASTPKTIQAAAARVSRSASVVKMDPLLIIPFLSAENAALIEKQKVSCVDLCGNGIIYIPGRLLVSRSGAPNLFKDIRTIKNIYRGESSIVARAFLLVPVFRSLSTLHDHLKLMGGDVSISTVSKAVTRLEEDLIVSKDGHQIQLLQPEKLLDALSTQYESPKVVDIVRGKTKEPIDVLWHRLDLASSVGFAKVCRSGRSSVNEYAVMAEDSLRTFYTDSPVEHLLKFCQANLQETNRFPDVEIIRVADKWPFFDKRKSGLGFVASPIQTYLELASGDKRQEEVSKQVETLILRELDWNRWK
jgi:hypothetical protein